MQSQYSIINLNSLKKTDFMQRSDLLTYPESDRLWFNVSFYQLPYYLS